MNQKGFAGLIVVIIAAVIAVGMGGYFLYSKQSAEKPSEDLNEAIGEVPAVMPVLESEGVTETVIEKKSDAPKQAPAPAITKGIPVAQSACSRVFSPKYSVGPHYTGPLFDAHFHMPILFDPNKIDPSKIEGHGNIPTSHADVDTDAEIIRLLCNFEREKVRGAIGFTIGEEQLLDETLAGAKSMKARVGGKVDLFLSPVGFSAASLENIETSDNGLFDGYGELSFGFGGMPDQSPDDQKFLDIYKVAGENNLIVMIHLGAQQGSRAENILQKNPNVTFLFHGPESENYIHGIIGKYPNAYYSIDAILIRLPSTPGALMYMVSSKDEFKTKFAQNYGVMLNNTINQWKSKIEQYPDRYMWGTDRSDPWTYDEDVSALIEEFSRAFIAKLGSAVQEKFAYKNAERLLQK